MFALQHRPQINRSAETASIDLLAWKKDAQLSLHWPPSSLALVGSDWLGIDRFKQWIGREVEWGRDVGIARCNLRLCLIGKWAQSSWAKIYCYGLCYSLVNLHLVRAWDTAPIGRSIKNKTGWIYLLLTGTIWKTPASTDGTGKKKPFVGSEWRHFLCVTSPRGLLTRL